MGLITKEVEVVLAGTNIKHFEDLGYEIPRHYNKHEHKWSVKIGTTIKVKTCDLQNNSNARVNIECDSCKRRYDVAYYAYSAKNREGNIYCKSCTAKLFRSGENHPLWKQDLTEEERDRNRCSEKSEFVRKVMARDNAICQCCGKNAKVVHHLDGYNWCVEKRYDETNGIALCKNCHTNFHGTYGYGYNTKQQFEEWLGYALGELLKYDGEILKTRKIIEVDTLMIYNSAQEISNKYDVSKELIYASCNKVKKNIKKHCYLYYDEYLKMSEEEIKKHIEWAFSNDTYTEVICLNSLIVFKSIADAKSYYNIKANIVACCKGERKSAGKLPDGTKLHWMYYKDYLKLSNKEKQDLENKYKIKNKESEVA